MKFVYVLVSNDKDIYYEETLVSVLSLKHQDPDAYVSLVVDNGTDATFTGARAALKSMVQEYKVVEFPPEISNLARSRLLKTNLRNHIRGDMLYLDSDTAFADALPEFPEGDFDVAAVTDLHSRENDPYHLKHKVMNRNKELMGFGLSLGDLYFNGGVIFARDNEKAKEFFDTWHALYKECNKKGIFTDQISFNETNNRLGFPLGELPGTWNCQVREAYNHLTRVKDIYPLLCSAKIIHFFGSGIDGKKEPHPLMKKEFFEKIKQNGIPTQKDLEIIYDPKHAFWSAPEVMDPSKTPLFFLYCHLPGKPYSKKEIIDKLTSIKNSFLDLFRPEEA